MADNEDSAVNAIELLVRSGHSLTYAWLKQQFGRTQISEDIWRSLNRGRAIIQTVDQLNQYLYSYAPMVASQWGHASKVLVSKSQGRSRLIDYGCGQGLAGLLLHDHLGSDFLRDIESIIAIEPSAVALRRAGAVYQALAPGAAISLLNKGFDDLSQDDLAYGTGPTVHIFSNVLDIDGYDHIALFKKALCPGKHTVIALGHDRTAHGYSQGMIRVKDALEAGRICPATTVHASGLERFTCGNRGEPAVLWLCALEVGE